MKTIDGSVIGRVGVLQGGVSPERSISLDSGRAVLSALHRMGVNAVALDIQEKAQTDVIAQIAGANIEVAFIALHGGDGEDGHIQGLLDVMKIPYTGSDMQASVLAMNKQVSKQLWHGIGLPTPRFAVLDDSLDFHQTLKSLGGSAMVKPAYGGSSIGMALVRNQEQLHRAYENARQYDSVVIAEQLLTGEEYTVAILNGEVLPVVRLETDRSFYDYDAKYVDNNTRYVCPCGLSPEREKALQALALSAFESLHCRGWGRVDIMSDELGRFQLLEVNTVPGMTSKSLVPMAAEAAGYSFDDVVASVLQTAMHTYHRQDQRCGATV